jgi:N-ethylmaleimide reductase
LNDFGLAYLHVMRGDFFGPQTGDVMTPIRTVYKGVLVGNMGYDASEADEAIRSGKLDAVAFGSAFLANPDLPARIRTGFTLNPPGPGSFYSPGSKGYTDYPTMDG